MCITHATKYDGAEQTSITIYEVYCIQIRCTTIIIFIKQGYEQVFYTYVFLLVNTSELRICVCITLFC